MIERLAAAGRARVTAVYDIDEGKRRAAGQRLGVDPGLTAPEAVIESDDVDLVLVLTSMNAHGPLARAALSAGKHVLVEKPMATSLEEAAALLELATESPGHLVCAPHILLSPTYRAVHAHVQNGDIGRLLLARARYGWSGPDWGALVLRARRRRALRPRRLQRHRAVRLLRPGAARHGDGGRRDRRARRRGRGRCASRPRTTRTC